MKAFVIALWWSLFVVALPSNAAAVNQPVPVNQTVVKNKININKADVATLTGSFKGIGKKRAEAIVSYRESHKGFKSLEELSEVKGFGARFVETNRDKLKEVFVIN